MFESLKPGDVITVKHLGINKTGTLNFPEFLRIREDVTWKELEEQYKRDEAERFAQEKIRNEETKENLPNS